MREFLPDNPTLAAGRRDKAVAARGDSATNPFVPISPTLRVWVLIFGFVYASVITIGRIIWLGDGVNDYGLVLLSDLFFIGCVYWPIIFYKPSYGYAHPLIFMALMGIIDLVIRKAGIMITGLTSHMLLPNLSAQQLQFLFAYGNFVDGLALLSLYAGFACYYRIPAPSLGLVSTVPPFRLYAGIALGALVGFGALLLYARQAGGISKILLLIAKGAGARSEMMDGDEKIGTFIVMGGVAALAALVWAVSRPAVHRNIFFLGFAGFSSLIGYAISGKRSSIIYSVFFLGLGWILKNRRMPIFRIVLIGVTCFLLIGLLGIYRWTNSTKSQVSFDFLSEVSLSDVAGATMGELSLRGGEISTYYTVLALVPESVKPLWGKSYIENVTRFIPRFLWPNKPRGIDFQAGMVFANSPWGMPPGAVGEAYWNLQLPGVVLVFFVFGIFLRWLSALLIENPLSPAVMAFYVLSVQYLDPSQNGFRQWIQRLIPLLVLVTVMGFLRRTRPTEAFRQTQTSNSTLFANRRRIR